MPIFQSRFGSGARTVKAAVAAGRLGRLSLASAYVKWQRTPGYYADSWHGTFALDGGGALMNQGIHAVDLLQWFAGLPADVFSRNTRRVHLGIEVEDTAVASLRFPCGALGTIEATTAAYPGWARRIELCGKTAPSFSKTTEFSAGISAPPNPKTPPSSPPNRTTPCAPAPAHPER
jgi:UDP-N-acetyl-2-amino-2-deoxyglucuronate dehydrogenase